MKYLFLFLLAAAAPVEMLPVQNVTGSASFTDTVTGTGSHYTVLVDATAFDNPKLRVWVTVSESFNAGQTWLQLCQTALPGGKGLNIRSMSCQLSQKTTHQMQVLIEPLLEVGPVKPGFMPERGASATMRLGVSVIK